MSGRVIALCIAVAAAAMPLAGAAQVKNPADAAGGARSAAARILVQTLQTEQQMRAQTAKSAAAAGETFDRLVPAQAVMQAQINDPQGFARIREAAVKLIADDRERLAEETIPLMIDAEVRRYASHYTLDELKALNDFYRSPIGQRVIAEQPAMAADNTQFQQSVLTPIANAHSGAVGPKLAALLAPLLHPAPPATAKKP